MFIIHMKKKSYKKILTIPVLMIAVGLVGAGAERLFKAIIYIT